MPPLLEHICEWKDSDDNEAPFFPIMPTLDIIVFSYLKIYLFTLVLRRIEKQFKQ